MANVRDDDHKRVLLNQLVLNPSLKPAAKAAKIGVTTMFRWLRESMQDPTNKKHRLQWLGHEAPFFEHVNAARKLNVVALDHAARDLAINGHVEKRFHDGRPVWRIDPKVAADAATMTDDEWFMFYGDRKRTDIFERDPETGGYVQEVVTSPPNPAILIKLLTSLAPEVYSDRSEINVTMQGAVWIEGQTPSGPAPKLIPAAEAFALTTPADQVKRPINTLAVPRPCKDSEEFDQRFRKKLLREVVLFRNAEGRLLSPLPTDVVVVGTRQYHAFVDAGIEVQAVHPTTLLDEGFENSWLRALAPHHKRKPPKIDAAPMPEAGVKMSDNQEIFTPQAPPGKASGRWDRENLGNVRPPPGGRRVSYDRQKATSRNSLRSSGRGSR